MQSETWLPVFTKCIVVARREFIVHCSSGGVAPAAIRYQAIRHQCIRHQASGIRHQASGHQASGIRHQASGIRHQASGIRHQASGIRHQASGGRSSFRRPTACRVAAADCRRLPPAAQICILQSARPQALRTHMLTGTHTAPMRSRLLTRMQLTRMQPDRNRDEDEHVQVHTSTRARTPSIDSDVPPDSRPGHQHALAVCTFVPRTCSELLRVHSSLRA